MRFCSLFPHICIYIQFYFLLFLSLFFFLLQATFCLIARWRQTRARISPSPVIYILCFFFSFFFPHFILSSRTRNPIASQQLLGHFGTGIFPVCYAHEPDDKPQLQQLHLLYILLFLNFCLLQYISK